MILNTQDKVAAIRKLIIQMNDTNDARHLVNSLLENDRQEMMRLRREFGSALRPIIGNPNGYYVLDLSNEMDRMCICRLLEISTTSGAVRAFHSKLGPGRVGDYSQHGNWSSFRNEMYNGNPITLTPAFAQPIPTMGVLHFDFVSDVRPKRDAIALSDLRVVKVLLNHFLLKPRDAPVAMKKLRWLEERLDQTLSCSGDTFYECPMNEAKAISEHMEVFYGSIMFRDRHLQECLEKESSTLVDSSGNLLPLFTAEDGYEPPVLRDFFGKPHPPVGPLTAEQVAAAGREDELNTNSGMRPSGGAAAALAASVAGATGASGISPSAGGRKRQQTSAASRTPQTEAGGDLTPVVTPRGIVAANSPTLLSPSSASSSSSSSTAPSDDRYRATHRECSFLLLTINHLLLFHSLINCCATLVEWSVTMRALRKTASSGSSRSSTVAATLSASAWRRTACRCCTQVTQARPRRQ